MKEKIEIGLDAEERQLLEKVRKAYSLPTLSDALRFCAVNFAAGVGKIFLDRGVITPTEQKAGA